ncbi:hypothetical protein DFJ74DRAFT_179359 [Hyaloraphidium curvatum]|nr:hypothetical protein DFJ74DRAFT_179359 [Hyaloraphidium curvatum]
MLRSTALVARVVAKSAAVRTALPAAAVCPRMFATAAPKAQRDDVIQKLYLDALRSYTPAAETEKPDLPDKVSKPAVPAAPALELSPAEPIEEGGEIVLVRAEDFPAYVDPIENPEDWDPWWDYSIDSEVFPVRRAW